MLGKSASRFRVPQCRTSDVEIHIVCVSLMIEMGVHASAKLNNITAHFTEENGETDCESNLWEPLSQ